MKNLLYKEFQLAIHPAFFLISLFGVLVLIPQWPYFIALMYFFFISIPNIFAMDKAQNDVGFSATLPIRRADIVNARLMSTMILELVQILVTAIFAFINMKVYHTGNFLMSPNFAFFGFVFVMFGLFNVIYFPMFYKTADKYGWPLIVGFIAIFIYVVAVEASVLLLPAAHILDGTTNIPAQLVVLGGGIIVFLILSQAAGRLAVKRFEKINL